MRSGLRKVGVLFVLCLLLTAAALPVFAVNRRVVLVGAQETYTLGETLQLQAQLVPVQADVKWEWYCRMPGAEEETVVGRENKLMLPLTAEHDGAVLCPVAVLTDGTAVRGPEKVLKVAVWYSGLELETMPAKTNYQPGEAFASKGVKVLAVRGDGSREDVTARCTFTPETLELGATEVLAVCELRRENGEVGAFGCRIPVTVTAPKPKPEQTKPVEPDKPADQPEGDASGGTEIPDDPETPSDPDDAKQPDGGAAADGLDWSEADGELGLIWICVGLLAVAGAFLLGFILWRKSGKDGAKKGNTP